MGEEKREGAKGFDPEQAAKAVLLIGIQRENLSKQRSIMMDMSVALILKALGARLGLDGINYDLRRLAESMRHYDRVGKDPLLALENVAKKGVFDSPFEFGGDRRPMKGFKEGCAAFLAEIEGIRAGALPALLESASLSESAPEAGAAKKRDPRAL